MATLADAVPADRRGSHYGEPLVSVDPLSGLPHDAER
jgi:hypothetical protein